MAKTSVILTQTSQLKDQPDSVLIEAGNSLSSDLITAAQKAQITINALTDSLDLTEKQLTGDGFPKGCFIVFDLRKFSIKIDDFLVKLSGLFQFGYQIGLINDLAKYSDDEIKKLQLYKIYLINSGKDNKNQDATIKDSNINDVKGKLAKNRSLVEFRDFTNVPTPQAGARVGIGKDTSGLQGGPAIGYSTNGRDFYAAITPYGFTFRKRDAENMWRLLRPKQRDDIDDVVGETVKKEVDSATAGVSDAVNNASDAVSQAESAVAASKVNSDAIKSMQSAASDAQASANKAISDAQAAIKNVASDAQAIKENVTSVQSQVNSAQSANDARVVALQKHLDDAQSSISATSASLDKVSANLDTYAKSATEQGHDITEIKKQQGRLEADLASANGNVTQLQATVNGIQGNLKDTNSNVASLSATASQAGLAIKNAQSQVASVIIKADTLQATIADQDKNIHTLQADSKTLKDDMADAKGNISSLQKTATSLDSEFKDHDGRLSKVEQTASTLTNEFSDEQGHFNRVEQTAQGTQQTVANQQGQINSIQTDAAGIHETLTGQGNQIANINVTLSGLNSKYDGVSGDLSKLSDKVTTNSTQIDQDKKLIALKADQTTVDNLSGEVSQNSAQLKVQADQISSKVTATDVNNIVDKKGYATTSTVQSLITQKAGKINESITNLDAKYKAKDGVNLVRASSFHNVTLDDLKNSGWSLCDKAWINKNGGSNKQGSIVIDATSITTGVEDIVQTIPLEPDTDYTLSFHLLYAGVAPGKSFNAWSYVVEEDSNGKAVSPYVDNNHPMLNSDDRKLNTRTFHTSKNTHQGVLYLRAMPGTKIELEEVKLERGAVATQWTPAPYDNATVTQFQQITATLDGLQSTVVNKADTSQITQLSNLIQSKVSSNDFTSKISQLSNDINARVAKGDLMSQINIEAGQTLIQSNKLFLDADTIVFSKNSKAFIPDAAIENLSLDKLTTGHITVPIADKYGNQIELGNDGINVSSALEPIDWSGSGTGYQDDKSRFNFNVSSHGMSFTNHIEYGKSTVKTHASDDYQFLNLTPDVLHYTNGSTDEVKVPSGMTMYVPVNATSTLGPQSPGGFFAIGHEQIGDNGATSDKTIDIAYVAKQINGWKQGLHVNTTIYSKPAGASHNMRTAWVSWSQWDAGEHYPAIISDGKWWGGICFPSTGKVTLFDPYGHAMWLTQGNVPYSAWGDDYNN